MIYNNKSCSVMCLGTELTRGIVQDKHTAFLGQELLKLGIWVKRVTFLPDDFDTISLALQQALADSTMVILSGGLGPTSDDLTRDIVAHVAKKSLVFIESAWESIKKRSWGKKVPESNKKQAYIPEGFSVLHNTRGTACGFYGNIDNTEIFVLPGPPVELQSMFLGSVVPVINRSFKIQKSEELICSLYMVSESYLEDCFQEVKAEDVCLQTRLEKDRIICTLYGSTQESREKTFVRLVEILGQVRIRRGNRSIAEIVLEEFIKKKKLLGFAESCTGGLLGAWITDLPGSSDMFWGSIVAYANSAKTKMLGVDPSLISTYGAVSGEVVSAMAAGVLNNSDSDIAVAVSGIAGPGGSTGDKPVGTVWIGLCTKNNVKKAQCFHFSGNRSIVRKKSAVVCFFFAEYALLEYNVLDIPVEW